MTENETLEKQIKDYLREVLKEAKDRGCIRVSYFRNIPLQNIETIINVLEEIQQYRAIGRVEEVKYLVDSYNDMMHDFGDNMLALEQYKAIGTVEELKKIEESFNVISDKVWNYILAGEELLERYEAIGTVEEFKDLKEKNTKKRFNIFESHGMRQFVCGCCDRPILTTDNYCSFCGQKLDW